MTYDTLILGAGPAGISSAIQCSRTDLSFCIIEQNKIGGLCNEASKIENYPGFPNGVEAKKLISLLKEQLKKTSIEIVKERVISLQKKENFFVVKTDTVQKQSKRQNFHNYMAKSVIVATGTIAETPYFSYASKYPERIFYSLTNFPRRTSNSDTAIIGGGDISFDYAISISKRGGRSTIICRNDKPRAIPILFKKTSSIKEITLYTASSVLDISVERGKINILLSQKNKKISLISDYLLIACGRKKNLEFIDSTLIDVLKIYKDGTTNVKGLFFAGDVHRKKMRQIGIAVGDGLYSAMCVEEYLTNNQISWK